MSLVDFPLLLWRAFIRFKEVSAERNQPRSGQIVECQQNVQSLSSLRREVMLS